MSVRFPVQERLPYARRSDKTPALVWFRRDLRLDDPPALYAAAAWVIPVFVLDDETPVDIAPVAASPRRAPAKLIGHREAPALTAYRRMKVDRSPAYCETRNAGPYTRA